MGPQLENEIHDIEDEEDDRSTARKFKDEVEGVWVGLIDGGVERRRNDEGGRCDSHERGHSGGDDGAEFLFVEKDSTKEETHSQYLQVRLSIECAPVKVIFF